MIKTLLELKGPISLIYIGIALYLVTVVAVTRNGVLEGIVVVFAVLIAFWSIVGLIDARGERRDMEEDGKIEMEMELGKPEVDRVGNVGVVEPKNFVWPEEVL